MHDKSEPNDDTSLTDTEVARSASPPSPPAKSHTDRQSTDDIEEEERRGWPDEPTTC